jgi:hypothetical protein
MYNLFFLYSFLRLFAFIHRLDSGIEILKNITINAGITPMPSIILHISGPKGKITAAVREENIEPKPNDRPAKERCLPLRTSGAVSAI